MYSEKDLLEVNKQLKGIIAIISVAFAVFLALSILLSIYVGNTYGMIALILGVCIDVFVWGMYGNPVRVYKRFLDDLLTGQSHLREVYVKDVNPQPVYKDNKLFYYEILVQDEGIERMYLLDANKMEPDIEMERRYQFRVHENYIVGIDE